MKTHYHLGVDNLILLSLGLPLLWHLYRMGAAAAVRQGGGVGKFGEAVGGFFTFGGMS